MFTRRRTGLRRHEKSRTNFRCVDLRSSARRGAPMRPTALKLSANFEMASFCVKHSLTTVQFSSHGVVRDYAATRNREQISVVLTGVVRTARRSYGTDGAPTFSEPRGGVVLCKTFTYNSPAQFTRRRTGLRRHEKSRETSVDRRSSHGAALLWDRQRSNFQRTLRWRRFVYNIHLQQSSSDHTASYGITPPREIEKTDR